MKKKDDSNVVVVGVRFSPSLLNRVEALTDHLAKSLLLGRPKTSDVIRAAVEHGIEAIAKREGFDLPSMDAATEPEKAPQKKNLAGVIVHRSSLARSVKRAQERAAAGCKCNPHSHVKTCKLYKGKA